MPITLRLPGAVSTSRATTSGDMSGGSAVLSVRLLPLVRRRMRDFASSVLKASLDELATNGPYDHSTYVKQYNAGAQLGKELVCVEETYARTKAALVECMHAASEAASTLRGQEMPKARQSSHQWCSKARRLFAGSKVAVAAGVEVSLVKDRLEELAQSFDAVHESLADLMQRDALSHEPVERLMEHASLKGEASTRYAAIFEHGMYEELSDGEYAKAVSADVRGQFRKITEWKRKQGRAAR